jgi:NAD(P)-dependent dehydrogenase (short-subunit alcohol dehydrogenase family)
MRNTMELTGKVAVITGAAGGIGRATARLFAREGAAVALVDVNDRAARNMAEEIRTGGGRVASFALDVSDEQQVVDLVRSVTERLGGPDIVVNNAGISLTTPILETSAAEWDRVLAVNLRSVFLLSREAFRVMKTKGEGKIVNIASASGKIGGLVVGAHYAASKAGVICFTKSLALQAAPYHINVNAVCPGPTRSPMTDAWGDATNAEFASKIPFKRYGEPEEIAEAILFLASSRSSYITGEIVDVTGGMIMD